MQILKSLLLSSLYKFSLCIIKKLLRLFKINFCCTIYSTLTTIICLNAFLARLYLTQIKFIRLSFITCNRYSIKLTIT